LKTDKLEQEFIARVTDSQGIVHKICRIYCKDEEDRKDLFQEILIQLWKSYPSFRGEAINDFQNLPEIKKEETLEEEIRVLYVAIARLNDIEKAIIMLYLEEKNNEEIAEIIGITQNYVRVKMNRIKLKLKKILNP